MAGTARLVGTDSDRVTLETFLLLDKPSYYLAMSRAHNPFGDGVARERIVRRHLAAIDTRGIWRDMPVRNVSTRVAS